MRAWGNLPKVTKSGQTQALGPQSSDSASLGFAASPYSPAGRGRLLSLPRDFAFIGSDLHSHPARWVLLLLHRNQVVDGLSNLTKGTAD